MNFLHLNYLPWIILFFSLFALITLFFEFRYFRWIKRYFFFRRTWINRFSTLFYLAGIFLLLISLMDLRGKETNIKGNIPDQKTILLLDTSMSMLAEDVRPNRFGRALLIARHFVSKAIGHQIAIALFSDSQKRLVPFTDDTDLLDSRLSGLETLNLDNAGTNLRQAILETVSLLKEEAGAGVPVTGNIVIISDAEENAEDLKFSVPEGVNVAFIGMGTLQGAPIPIRSTYNNSNYFESYKMKKGEKVITKLNEDLMRSLGNKIKNYRYWVASSYSLPTEEILDFFRTIHKMKMEKGDMKIRPVMYEKIVIPGILFLVASFILSFFRTFKIAIAFILFFSLVPSKNVLAQEEKEEISPHTKIYLEKLKKGELQSDQKRKLGEFLLKDKKFKEALEIYKEGNVEKTNDVEAKFNYGTTYLKEGNLKEGAVILSKLKSELEKKNDSSSKEMIKSIEANLSLALKEQEKKKDKKKDDEKQKQDEKKDSQQNKKNDQDKKDEKSKQGEKKEQNDKQNKNDDKKQNTKDKQDKKEDKKEDKKNEEPKDEKKEESKPQSVEQREEGIRRQKLTKKIPGMLKELMNVDRQLQQKYIDTRTKEKNYSPERKDW